MEGRKWENMLEGFEGGFYQALAIAYSKADTWNRAKIEKGFPEIKEIYDEWYYKGC